jgi:phosphoribosyl-ATP pyrophosphohydrolase
MTDDATPTDDDTAPDDATDVTDRLTDGGSDATDHEEILDDLFALIESRKADLPEDSYTTSLFTHEKGENAVLEKLGEESTEIVLAAKDDDPDELLHESADFVYHLLVLLAMKDLELDDLRAELAERFG